MVITKDTVKFFEAHQKEYGTEVALENILWENAACLLKDIGVIGIKTKYLKKKKGQY